MVQYHDARNKEKKIVTIYVIKETLNGKCENDFNLLT